MHPSARDRTANSECADVMLSASEASRILKLPNTGFFGGTTARHGFVRRMSTITNHAHDPSSGGMKPWRKVFSEIVLGSRNCRR